MISFDCFLYDTGLVNEINLVFFKVIISGLTPILLIVLFIIFFHARRKIIKEDYELFKKKIIISTIVILFLVHPSISDKVFKLFFCMELDQGKTWLKIDLDLRCWQEEHLKFILILGLPILVIWIVGVPVLGLVLLFKNRKNLEEDETFHKYRMLY